MQYISVFTLFLFTYLFNFFYSSDILFCLSFILIIKIVLLLVLVPLSLSFLLLPRQICSTVSNRRALIVDLCSA